jgi:signal transduction histidine kinase
MFRRLRWSAFGLRGRIVGMVLTTTVATLAVATLGLLPRLESSLRNASKTTLKHGVDKGIAPGGRIVRFARYVRGNYTLAFELGDRALQADVPSAGKTALEVAHQLGTKAAELHDDLGASSLVLIGSIDPTGVGRVIPLQGTEPVSDAIQKDAVNSAIGPFLHDEVGYSYPTIDGVPYVRALIPFRKDDALLAVYNSIYEIPDAVSAVRKAFEIAAAAGLLLTLLIAIPLTARLARRIQNLRQAALRVAVAGAGAGIQFPVDRARDEVGDLARSFAIMQRRLRHQEEARRAFVATASHELRTPLASLDGMLELLAEGLRDEQPDLADAEDLLERARAQSRRLGRLAADLLDLSRLDAEVALRSEPVELSELARAVLAEFELALHDRGVTADLRDESAPVWALADPGSVARILRILIDNGLRVAPRGSSIVVALSSEPSPTLSVSDRGPGIAPEERALIFERFKRGRDTGGEAGFGLGLAIGRELAERMAGTLVLANTPGPGATFTLTLTAAQAPTGPANADRTPSESPVGPYAI